MKWGSGALPKALRVDNRNLGLQDWFAVLKDEANSYCGDKKDSLGGYEDIYSYKCILLSNMHLLISNSQK